MYTRCPHCQTVFRLHAEQLAAAAGEVCCSACGNRFNALESLYDTRDQAFAPPADEVSTPADASARTTEPAASAPAGEADEAVIYTPSRVAPGWAVQVSRQHRAPAEEADTAAAAGAASASGSESVTRDTVEIPAALLEDFQGQPAPRTGVRLLQGTALVALLLLMLGQWVYVQRETLYSLHEWQPWLEGFCGVLGCELPLHRAPDLLVIKHKDVRAHPQVENALLINLTLVNRAGFAQAYPLVGMFFSDLTGQTRAGRWFRPETYLPAPEDVDSGVKPGESVDVRLEVVDPGVNLISYQFDFR